MALSFSFIGSSLVSAAPSALTTVSIPAQTSGEEDEATGTVSNNGTLELDADGATDQLIGITFRDIPIVSGASISSAYIQFTAADSTTATQTLTIWGDDTNNSSLVSSAAMNISNRPKTATSVAWSVGAWNVNDATLAQRTPDLTGIINEIISNNTFILNNDMTFIIDGLGTDTHSAFSASAAAGLKPELVIEYDAIVLSIDTFEDLDGDNINSITDPDLRTRVRIYQRINSTYDQSLAFLEPYATPGVVPTITLPANVPYRIDMHAFSFRWDYVNDYDAQGMERFTSSTDGWGYIDIVTPTTDLDVRYGFITPVETAGFSQADEFCYLVSDGYIESDTFRSGLDTLVDFTLTNGAFVSETVIITPGATTVTNIEASAFNPNTQVMYASNAFDLGTIDTATGAYTQVGIFGIYSNTVASPPITATISDADGIAYDPINDIWYGVERTNDNSLDDRLFVFDPAQAPGDLIVRGFFGGADFVEVAAPAGNLTLNDIDDLTFNPVTGQLLGVANLDGSPTRVVIIDPVTGATVDLGEVYFDPTGNDDPANYVPVFDIEGLAYSPTGALYGVTGQWARLYEISLTGSGGIVSADLIRTITDGNPMTDLESLTCNTALTVEIGDTVWLDTNGNGLEDDGPTGIPGVLVNLLAPDGTVAATTMTDSNGNYLFSGLPSGFEYTVEVDSSNFAPGGPLAGLAQSGDPDSDLDDSATSALLDGETDTEDLTLDFGYTPSGAIGNYIWLDEDGDGEQDAGERGLPGVVVTLEDGSGNVFTTTTDANGGYLFDNLPQGTYTVSVDQSQPALTDLSYTQAALAGADFGNQDPAGYVVDLDPGEVNLTADFGFNYGSSDTNTGNAALGDTIWADIDGDGFQDPDEIGIAGITVTATASDGTVYTTTTDAQGHYIFPNLPPEAYIVEVVNPPAGWTATGDPDHYGTTGTSNNITDDPIILAPGDFVQIVDFGYQPPAGDYDNSIGDTIWFDADADGVQDGGVDEPGIAGVTVSLLDSAGNVIATTTTDENGMYLFDNLPDGTYSVVVNDTNGVLNGLTQTGDPDAAIDATSTTTVTGGMADLDQDFGYAPSTQSEGEGLIGDYIWLDQNGDGMQDAGEQGLAGVIVTLTDSNGDVITTTTDANGQYWFPGLDVDADGETYTVTVVTSSLPADVTSTYDPDNMGDPFVSVVTIDTTDPINLEQDFGVNGINSLEGTIWEDSDADGTLTTETSFFAGVTVVLYDSNGNVVGTTETDNNGDYSFEGLPDGEYTVVVEDANGILDGYWHSDGPNDGADDNSQTDPYVVDLDSDSLETSPVVDTTADFGYYIDPASVGNYIWIDTNGDGIQNDGQTGINGVEVMMVIEYPDGTSITLTTVTATDSNGNDGWYSFDNLLMDEDYNGDGAGSEPTYTITVDTAQAPLSGYVPTTSDSSSATDLTDSDDPNGVSAEPEQGQTNVDSTNATDAQAGYDFGFVDEPTYSIGNYIWLEDGGPDGVLDSGETGIDGVLVELWDGPPNQPGSSVITTTTTNNGAYHFDDLPMDTYYVHVPASNFNSGGPLYDATEDTPLDVSTAYTGVLTDDVAVGTGDATNGVSSGAIVIGDGNQPLDEDLHGISTSYADSDTEWNVDFAFFVPSSTAISLGSFASSNGVNSLPFILALLTLTSLTVVFVRKQQA